MKSSVMSFSTMWLSFKVCREFQRGNCTRGENDCRYAHPIDIAMIDTNENTVTVCMDYIKGRCSREKCKYFHPPAHLQAKIKAAQHQVNQTAAAAMVSRALIKLYFYCWEISFVLYVSFAEEYFVNCWIESWEHVQRESHLSILCVCLL